MTEEELRQVRQAKEASRLWALAPAEQRGAALLHMANRLAEGTQAVLAANHADLEEARATGADWRRIQSLTLSAESITGMASCLRTTADYADPVGRLLEAEYKPNGLRREKRLVPLGVVAVVYEARPGVLCDCAALCLRTGNALVLRCSHLSRRTDEAIAALLRRGLEDAGLPEDGLQLLSREGHDLTLALSRLDRLVDLLIIRGGYDAVADIRQAATVPVISAGPGNCHIYIDASARPDMAQAIVLNSKVPRPLACNAAETLLVHQDWPAEHLSALLRALTEAGIALRGCPRVTAQHPELPPAGEEDWAREYFAPCMAVRLVSDIDEAIGHINTYRTPHTEAIVTEDPARAARFLARVEANVVCHNVSTRMTDGMEFGLGGELGISTQKYPYGGPLGMAHLMQQKYYLMGNGTLR